MNYKFPRWKIYYGDGTVFSSTEGPPENAPPWNVQDIIQIDLYKQQKYHQCFEDYYIYKEKDKAWYGVDLIGLIDFLVNEIGLVKLGRTIPTKKFIAIRKRADREFN